MKHAKKCEIFSSLAAYVTFKLISRLQKKYLELLQIGTQNYWLVFCHLFYLQFSSFIRCTVLLLLLYYIFNIGIIFKIKEFPFLLESLFLKSTVVQI